MSVGWVRWVRPLCGFVGLSWVGFGCRLVGFVRLRSGVSRSAGLGFAAKDIRSGSLHRVGELVWMIFGFLERFHV